MYLYYMSVGLSYVLFPSFSHVFPHVSVLCIRGFVRDHVTLTCLVSLTYLSSIYTPRFCIFPPDPTW